MNYIDNVIEFLLDENRQLSSKAAVVVFVIIAILLVDNILGFSYYFSTEKKIEQIQKLNSIIKDSTTDSTTRAFALQLRSKAISRENIFDQTASFLRSIKWSSSKKQQLDIPKESTIYSTEISKSGFWFNVTAGGAWYLLAIIMIPAIIFGDKSSSLPQRIATSIVAVLLLSGIGFLFYWVFSFIPQISKTSWTWNYIVNFLLQALIISLLIIRSQKKQ